MASRLNADPAGLVRAFADFSELPELLRLAQSGGPPETIPSRWANHLRSKGANFGHVEDSDLPNLDDRYPYWAQDAWQLCRKFGLVSEAGGVADEALAALDAATSEREGALQGLLKSRIEDRWQAVDSGTAVIPLLVEGATRVAGAEAILGTGLLLCEMVLLIALAGDHEPAKGEKPLDLVFKHRQDTQEEIQGDESAKGLSQIGKRMLLANRIRELCLSEEVAATASGRPQMGLTEARATAILLVWVGVFDEAIPLGPTNCLVASLQVEKAADSNGSRAPVLAKGGPVSFPELDAAFAAYLTRNLLEHSVSTNDAVVFPQLGIDMDSRRLGDSVPDVERRRVHEWRKINKALSMELLTSELLSRIDHAETVHAQLGLRNGHPFRAAGAGDADIEVAYPDLPNGDPISLVAEVSARRNMTRAAFREQLDQALRHAQRLQRDRGGVVYALVVNGGRVGSDPGLQAAFRSFVDDSELDPDGPVRLVPLCALDLASAIEEIVDKSEAAALRFGTELLADSLERLSRGLLGTKPEGDDWMRDILVEAAVDGASLPLEGGEWDEDDEPSGPGGMG